MFIVIPAIDPTKNVPAKETGIPNVTQKAILIFKKNDNVINTKRSPIIPLLTSRSILPLSISVLSNGISNFKLGYFFLNSSIIILDCSATSSKSSFSDWLTVSIIELSLLFRTYRWVSLHFSITDATSRTLIIVPSKLARRIMLEMWSTLASFP